MTIDCLKCRTQDLEIPDENPFQNDKLGRSQIADILTDVASFYGQSGCVMALDGEWGAGKTTFVKMWEKSLQKKGFKTLYFNAWSSDYSDDALMAIVSELQGLSPESSKSQELVEITGRILFTVGKIATKYFIGNGVDAIEALLPKNIGKECLNAYVTQKNTIKDFKNQVSEFVAFNAGEHPIVFFVDELDRCSPRYAVSVLERIKHLFEIPNIIFVLAINKVQLCNAIQGYFGSDQIDSNEYLRRFIDINYTLGIPDVKTYCKHLYNQYGFDDFFNTQERLNYFRNDSESDRFIDTAIQMCNFSKSNLRQIDRIFSYARLALMQFKANTYILPNIYFMLCFWKIMNPSFYSKLRNVIYTPQELLTELENILPKVFFTNEPSNYNGIHNIYTIAAFIFGYDKTSHPNEQTIHRPTLTSTDSQGNLVFNIKSNFFKKEDFERALYFYYEHYRENIDNGFTYLFQRIDLLKSFN